MVLRLNYIYFGGERIPGISTKEPLLDRLRDLTDDITASEGGVELFEKKQLTIQIEGQFDFGFTIDDLRSPKGTLLTIVTSIMVNG